MARGRKVRSSEADRLLQEWERSGERMSTWCEARGLNWYSLSAYKGWLETRCASKVAFAEVVVAEATPEPRYRIEVGPFAIEVDDRFEAETLQRLVRVVAAC